MELNRKGFSQYASRWAYMSTNVIRQKSSVLFSESNSLTPHNRNIHSIFDERVIKWKSLAHTQQDQILTS